MHRTKGRGQVYINAQYLDDLLFLLTLVAFYLQSPNPPLSSSFDILVIKLAVQVELLLLVHITLL